MLAIMKTFSKEDLEFIFNGYDLKLSPTYKLIEKNDELNKFCIKQIELYPEVFEKKSEVIRFIIYGYEFKYCKECGKPLKYKRFTKGSEFCSCRCSTLNKDTKLKLQATCLERYEQKYYSLTEECKHKISKTNKLNAEQRNKKREETNLKKYGVKCSLLNPEIRKKSKATILKKYGVEYISQNEIIKQKIANSNKNNKNSYNKNRNDRVWYLNNKKTLLLWERMNSLVEATPNFLYEDLYGEDKQYSWKCNYCGRIFLGYWRNGKLGTKCKCQCKYFGSFAEDQLFEIIKRKYPTAIHHNWGLLKENKQLEIDIFIPELNIGIEFNGLFWHSKDRKPSNYHFNKSLLADAAGIKLIQIWEDDETILDILEDYTHDFDNFSTSDKEFLIINKMHYFNINIPNFIKYKTIHPVYEKHKTFLVENCGYDIFISNKTKGLMKVNKKKAKALEEEIAKLEKELENYK